MSTKPNIPVKAAGDTFTAAELNTLVSHFENKPDISEDSLPLWVADYDSLNTALSLSPPWREIQKDPSKQGRLLLVDKAAVPGSGNYKPEGRSMRVEVRQGDVWNGSNRLEVLARNPDTFWSAPHNEWPDPQGSERWYGFNVYIPSDFATNTDASYWFSFMQLKGLNGGSPPINLEIKRTNFRLGGTRTNSALIPNDGTLGAVVKGQWHRFVVGVKLSTDPAIGWVEAWMNGVKKLERTSVATMDTHLGNPDPIYLKQGIYRATTWTDTHVLYFGSVKLGKSRQSVMESYITPTSGSIDIKLIKSRESDYIIEKIGTTIYAHPTGELPAYSGTDAYTVIQSAINQLTPPGTHGTGGGKIVVSKGSYQLSNELTITGWEAEGGAPQSQLQIEGIGNATRLVQNTLDKHAIVAKNRVSISLKNFFIYTGPDALSGIRLSESGEHNECSVPYGEIDNIHILAMSTKAPAFWGTNFFTVNVPRLFIYGENYTNIRLENKSTTTHYGNSNFGLVNCISPANDLYSGLEICSDNNFHMNLNQFSAVNIGALNGYGQTTGRGLTIRGGSTNTFSFVDLEYMKDPIVIEGDNNLSTYSNKILSGYIFPGAGGTGIQVAEACHSNEVKVYIEGVDSTSKVLVDNQQFRPSNSYDLTLGSVLLPSTIEIKNRTSTPLRYRVNGTDKVYDYVPKRHAKFFQDSGYVAAASIDPYEEVVIFTNVDETELPSPYQENGNNPEGQEIKLVNNDAVKSLIVAQYQAGYLNKPLTLTPGSSCTLKVCNNAWYKIN